jgi:hypothetical protein
MLRPIPSLSLTFQYLLIIQLFDAIFYELLTASLIKLMSNEINPVHCVKSQKYLLENFNVVIVVLDERLDRAVTPTVSYPLRKGVKI